MLYNLLGLCFAILYACAAAVVSVTSSRQNVLDLHEIPVACIVCSPQLSLSNEQTYRYFERNERDDSLNSSYLTEISRLALKALNFIQIGAVKNHE